ncbi:MAG: hypothetical protein Kow00123_28000 [Anaerolineales bacterium]
MPPNHFAKCPHCKNENVYDEAELLATKPGARGAPAKQPSPEVHEFVVTCQHCHQRFKIRIRITRGG